METILNAKISTGKNKFELSFDNEKEIILIKTTQQPQKNKANKEIIKELKKFFKTDIQIVFGLTSKEKKIKIYLPKEEVLERLKTHKLIL
jgi:uncharacterized protein (TIGR00251 family)